ncbi:hypothetical protein [Saccharopolyspora griseoalba]|uniref:Uncharacterized protein n=1 Tax=Saccharopolyspora griseoalba TaxID=1431848 RepID=A0ABW2LG82_9PSEU
MPTTSSGGGQRTRSRSTTKRRRSSESANAPESQAKAESPARTSIPVPYVTAQLHTLQIPFPGLPGRENLTSTAAAVRDQLPSRNQLLFYGGLTAAAALSVIEWPVAAAIGIGTAVVQRSAQHDDEA